ncbi:hypothetical protein CG006_02595 [Mesoplasma florum]|uniref:lipoprotein n=1 Tax=Mesoplasma florum TaxID=2151 RepID=UPI000D02D925|nr:lipoprotein [Mesoplasma florum]AVN63853.1 hypothetical protein CG006_02595 [Mesoplasma florum]
MKKLIAILGAVGLTATSATAVISCGSGDKNDNSIVNTIMKSTEFNERSYEIYEYSDSSKNTKESMEYPMIETIFFIWSLTDNENGENRDFISNVNQDSFKIWLKTDKNNYLKNLKENGKHYWSNYEDEKYGIEYENWTEQDIQNFEELIELLINEETNLNIGLINDSKFFIKVENKNDKYNGTYTKIINPPQI